MGSEDNGFPSSHARSKRARRGYEDGIDSGGASNALRNAKHKMSTIMRRSFGAYSPKDVLAIRDLFSKFDTDSDGQIEMTEFFAHKDVRESPQFKVWFGAITDGSSTFFKALDLDADGLVSLEEMLTIALPGANRRDLASMMTFLEDYKRQKRLIEDIKAGSLQRHPARARG